MRPNSAFAPTLYCGAPLNANVRTQWDAHGGSWSWHLYLCHPQPGKTHRAALPMTKWALIASPWGMHAEMGNAIKAVQKAQLTRIACAWCTY